MKTLGCILLIPALATLWFLAMLMVLVLGVLHLFDRRTPA